MLDFITLKFFITPYILVIMYIMGAFIMPFFSWLIFMWLKSKIISYFDINIDIKFLYKFIFYFCFTVCFLFMEISWRIMFEFMIAYFDMHDALMKLAY